MYQHSVNQLAEVSTAVLFEVTARAARRLMTQLTLAITFAALGLVGLGVL